jgi:hypothetical protein
MDGLAAGKADLCTDLLITTEFTEGKNWKHPHDPGDKLIEATQNHVIGSVPFKQHRNDVN